MKAWIPGALAAGSLLLAPALFRPASAQPLPPGVAAVMPFDIPYGAPITLSLAEKVAAAAVARAAELHWKEAIALTRRSRT